MSDITKLVAYDAGVPVEIQLDGTPLGITFWVRHIDSDEATEAGALHSDNKALSKYPRNIVVLAGCIEKWDWGEHDFEGKVPDLTLENAARVLSKAKWMVAQVIEAASDLGNFTTN